MISMDKSSGKKEIKFKVLYALTNSIDPDQNIQAVCAGSALVVSVPQVSQTYPENVNCKRAGSRDD